MEEDILVMYAQDVAKAEAILSRAEDGIDTELEIWNSVQLESKKSSYEVTTPHLY